MIISQSLAHIKSLLSHLNRRLKLIGGYTIKQHDNLSTKFPRPNRNKVIFKSLQISEIAGQAQAIDYVKKYNNGKYTNALHILNANKDIKCKETWLKHINSYFNSFGMSPITLKNSPDTRFQRLHSESKVTLDQTFLVSVIITAYNSEETIKLSVDSILNQVWKNLEVIIIDDNSTDNTWEIILELASLDNRIKAYRNTINVGSYVSKNIALKMISGKFFTCHDSDDWSHPERIYKQVIRMEQDKASASIILMLRAKHSMEITRFHKVDKLCVDGIARFSLISCMFNTDYFKKILGSWDTVRISADSELYKRANILLGKSFKKYKILGLVCLDAENSLTNHPEYGIKVSDKKNSPRIQYRDSYIEWHKSVEKSRQSAKLNFPQTKRMFEAPTISLTPNDDINKLLDYYKSNDDINL